MKDDAALLRSYADDRSEEAFAELVRRHLGLVYHAALRQCGGDPHRAEEVAQLVFTDLARKASALARRPLLVAWLHTGVRYAASHLHRAEARRLAREHEAFAMNQSEFAPEPSADWERLRPLIDDALQSLGERDRAAVLLRFFENRSYAELAASLSVTEDAARVRVNRAVEKLRATLARRGLVSTSSALALALAQPALAVTPAGLAAQIATSSLAAATFAGASTGLVSATLVSTAKITAGVAGAVALLSVGLLRHASIPSPDNSPPAPALSAADLTTILRPARLAPAEAAEALAAYLALPPLAATATQAEFVERSARLRALLTILPAEHVAQLLAATAGRPGDPEERLRRIAFTAWTELNAPASARWASSLTPNETIKSYQQKELIGEAALAWARTDFDAAYAWVTALRPGLARYVGAALLARLVLTDSDRALKLARAGDVAYFDAVRPWIFSAWLDRNPAAAFAALGSEMFATPGDRFNLPSYLARWARRDPQAALSWFDAQAYGTANERSEQFCSFISYFADKNPPPDFPALGAALAARAEAGIGRDRLEYFLRTWMSRDSASALRWLDGLPDASLREHVVCEAASYSSSSEPAEIIQLAHRLPAGGKRDKIVADLLTAWSPKDPDAALAWLETPAGRELAGPDAAHVARIDALARQDPAAAIATWNAIDSAATRRGTATSLARAWAATEPDAAAAWLFAQIPEGLNPYDQTAVNSLNAEESEAHWKRMQPYMNHAYAYNQIGSAWIARDPAGFVAWIETLPTAFQQRSALYALSWDAAARANADLPDPVVRLDLIAKLHDPAIRDPLMRDYLGNWLRFDEAAARRWAASNEAEARLPAAKNPGR